MNGIRTIFFDFGNVIAFFDHFKTVERLLPYSARGRDTLVEALYGTPRGHDFECGRLLTRTYIRRVFADAELSCDLAFFREAYGDIFTRNPDVCEMIPALAKRYRLVLASNTNAIHADDFLPKFRGTFQHFAHLVLSHEAAARKPDAEFFAHCQTYAAAEPHECLFVDDREDNIAAALAHGWRALHYSGPGALRRGLSEMGLYNEE